MRYQILNGQHWEKGIAYPSGSTIESDGRLDRAFPGRFKKLTESSPEDTNAAPVESRPRKKRRKEVH